MSGLTDEQLEELRGRLEQLRDELTLRLEATQASAKTVDLDEPIGRLSRVDAMQAQQLAKSQRRREELQLQMVGAALGRIRAGSYGECLRCEEAIGVARLRVAPESPLCLNCRKQEDER